MDNQRIDAIALVERRAHGTLVETTLGDGLTHSAVEEQRRPFLFAGTRHRVFQADPSFRGVGFADYFLQEGRKQVRQPGPSPARSDWAWMLEDHQA